MPKARRFLAAVEAQGERCTVVLQPVHVAIEINLDGHRDVLGLWMRPTDREGAK